jgi:hypothetical protein
MLLFAGAIAARELTGRCGYAIVCIVIDHHAPTERSNPGLLEHLADASIGVEERNQLLDAALDPEHLLPEIQLETIPDSRAYRRSFGIRNPEDNKVIGTIHYELPDPYEGDGYASVRSVGIHADYAGKGFGRATYLAVLKSLPAGTGLRNSEVSLTKGSLSVWRWLEDTGVVTSNDPNREAEPDNLGHYLGLDFRTVFGVKPAPEQTDEPEHQVPSRQKLSFLSRAVMLLSRRPK